MTEKSVVDIPIGSVVLANAGRDKGRYFVAVAASGGFVDEDRLYAHDKF